MTEAAINIVIPTFNRAEVFSVVGPRYYSALSHVSRIIVVNDASTDGTADMVRRWAELDQRVVLHDSKRHMGLPAARNVGLSYCDGTHVMFGEDDVVFENDATGVLLSEMEKIGADIISCTLHQLPERVKKIEMTEFVKERSSLHDFFLDDRYLYCHYDAPVAETIIAPFVAACFLAKAEVFKNIRFDETLGFDHFREESDMQLAAWEQGFKVAFTPKTRCYHMPAWMRSGGCFAGRPVKKPITNFMQRFYNNHVMWNKHAEMLKRLNPRRSRLSAEVLFFIHCLANAGYAHSAMLAADEHKALAWMLKFALKPAAALDVVTRPPAGYGTRGIGEL